MAINPFKYETYGETITLVDSLLEDTVYEEMGKRYTQALAKSMGTTKEALIGSLFGEGEKTWEKEVDFDGSEQK